MKLLLDTCVSAIAGEYLHSLGHDVVSSAEWPVDPGDEEILSQAAREHRVLITLDKDFGELAVLRGQSHAGIIRLVGIRAIHQGSTCQEVLRRHADDLRAGALITAEPGRVRIRPAER